MERNAKIVIYRLNPPKPNSWKKDFFFFFNTTGVNKTSGSLLLGFK